MKKLFLLTFMLFATTATFALAFVQDEVPQVDLTNVNVIVGILTPVVTLLATWLFKKFSTKITGTLTLLIVPVTAGLFTLITQALTKTDISWILQIALGAGATFLHQLYLYLTGKVTTS